MVGHGNGCRAVPGAALHHHVAASATNFDEAMSLEDPAHFAS
jgi:hypothetical protein